MGRVCACELVYQLLWHWCSMLVTDKLLLALMQLQLASCVAAHSTGWLGFALCVAARSAGQLQL